MMTPSLQTSMNSAASLRDELISYGNEGLLQELMAEVPPERIVQVLHAWLAWAHEHQRPPLVASSGADWNTWLILGGRSDDRGRPRHPGGARPARAGGTGPARPPRPHA